MRSLIATVAFFLAMAPPVAFGGSDTQTEGGNPPSVECASELWNGEYWKIQVNEGELGEIETNVPGAIQHVVFEGNFEWANLHTNDVFRWLFKSGNEETIPWDGRWAQGEGDSALMPENLSHITFCFTEEIPPSTTTSTTTSTPPSTTTSTTTTLVTTTTVSPTTTTLPEPTTTTAPPDPTTTTTAPPGTSTTTSTTEAPPESTTTTSTTEAPPESTTTTAAPPVTTTTQPPELPYTGSELLYFGMAGLTMLGLGKGLLKIRDRKRKVA